MTTNSAEAAIDYAADSPKGTVSPETMMLALRVLRGADYVADLEAKLKEAKAKLRELQEATLPTAMLKDGINSITATGGRTIELQNIVSARIPKAGQAEAMAWLKNNGHADLVKVTLDVAFPRNLVSEAMQAARELADMGASVTVKETVHPSTLKAWVKKVVPTGASLPLDLLHVYVGQKAVIAGQPETDSDE